MTKAHTHSFPQTLGGAPTPEQTSGIVHADDFASLQEAVDALGKAGGKVILGPGVYELHEPIRLDRRVVFQGVMDAKAMHSSTKIIPSDSFEGEWLFETTPIPASINPDLNANFGFYDLVVVGNEKVGGINGANIDVIRIERCRFAYMRTCLSITQVTDLERPYPARIVPGGVFINNSIFQATDICLNLEHATQNRIIGNWFVSNSGVVLRLLNTNKTWFVANEINQFTRAAVLLEDDGLGGNHVHNNVISLNWMHSNNPDTWFIETVNGDRMHNILISENIMEGVAGVKLPSPQENTGIRFADNVGEAVQSSSAGKVTLPVGQTRITVSHDLIAAPASVSITPLSRTPSYWVEQPDSTARESFEIVISDKSASPVIFNWYATINP